MNKTETEIVSWNQFTSVVRPRGCSLLTRLDDFHNSILVSGCQRSGTTMMSRILTESEGLVKYWFGRDDELDAGLILSGIVDHEPVGRYCFQTTYLDECYREYFDHSGRFKLLWIIRNPYSVAYSLLYNWPRVSLLGTFSKVAASKLNRLDRLLYSLAGEKWVTPIRQAALLFKEKTMQLFELYEKLGSEIVYVVDYDELVMNKETILPKIYEFVDLPYYPEYAEKIHSKSVDKKLKLSQKETRIVKQIAEPVYLEALHLKSTH